MTKENYQFGLETAAIGILVAVFTLFAQLIYGIITFANLDCWTTLEVLLMPGIFGFIMAYFSILVLTHDLTVDIADNNTFTVTLSKRVNDRMAFYYNLMYYVFGIASTILIIVLSVGKMDYKTLAVQIANDAITAQGYALITSSLVTVVTGIILVIILASKAIWHIMDIIAAKTDSTLNK